MSDQSVVGQFEGRCVARPLIADELQSAHTQEMKKEPWSRQRAIIVGLGLIGVVLALTWVVLYLNAGATSAP